MAFWDISCCYDTHPYINLCKRCIEASAVARPGTQTEELLPLARNKLASNIGIHNRRILRTVIATVPLILWTILMWMSSSVMVFVYVHFGVSIASPRQTLEL